MQFKVPMGPVLGLDDVLHCLEDVVLDVITADVVEYFVGVIDGRAQPVPFVARDSTPSSLAWP